MLDQIKEDLRSRTFEAQYQQQPIPDQGGLVTWSWFATHNGQPQRGPYDTMVVSWDTAMKDRGVNDYSIGIVARVRGTRQVHILDVIRVRLDFPTLRKRIVEEARRHNATTLIEAACSGIPLIQDLYGQISIIQRQPLGDKAVRLHAVTPMIEAGQVFLPARAPWLDAFRRELLSFPGRRYDDQVDALSQLLGWVRERNSSRNLQTTYRTTRG